MTRARDPENKQLLQSAFDAYVAGDRARGDKTMAVLRGRLPWWDRWGLRAAMGLVRQRLLVRELRAIRGRYRAGEVGAGDAAAVDLTMVLYPWERTLLQALVGRWRGQR